MIEEREVSLIVDTKLSPSSLNLLLATKERESDEESLKEREEIFGLVVERERERNQKWEERKKREIIKNSIYV